MLSTEGRFEKSSKWSIIILIFVLLFSILFVPSVGLFVAFAIACLVANTQYTNFRTTIIFILIASMFIILALYEGSVQKFIIREDDFTTYYNNYLNLVDGNYNVIFEFGGGVEIGLPMINLLFSFLIDSPKPYILQTFYIGLYFILLLYLISIDDFFSSKRKNDFMLLLWALLFLKLTAMLTIERQSIASFFVLYAVMDRRRKFFWIILGCCFHLSTPIVYLTVKYILNTRTYKKTLITSLLLIVFIIFSSSVLNILYSIMPNDKIGYVLYFINDKKLIENEIVKSLKQVVYIFPLIVMDIIFRLKGIKWSLGPSVLMFFCAMLILSFLPGVPTRLLMPIVFILFGFYYYNCACYLKLHSHLTLFILVAALLTIYKISLPGYFYRYPIADVYPAYYLSSFDESEGYIQRSLLPGIEDFTSN